MRRLILPGDILDALLAHARGELPNEACGLLAGERSVGRASTFHPARNEHASPLRYSIHPADLVRLVLGIEQRGEELVAIFHSHVASPAVPSATDVREADAYPGVVHLVASMIEPASVRGWRIDDGAAHEVELMIG